MKIRIKREFVYMVGTKERRVAPGVYSVPDDIDHELAAKILMWGVSETVVEKKAPENKLVKPAENKARVAKPPKRRSRTRTKPDA